MSEKKTNWIPLILGGMIALAAVVILLLSLFGDEIFPEYSPAHRGQQTARSAGCFACHGGVDGQGSTNPAMNGRTDSVPSIFQQRQSLSVLRQWIYDGISESKSISQAYLKSREEKALKMPGYRDRLPSDAIEDLVSYVALMQYRQSARRQTSGREGEKLARRYACFTCHGELGQGGVENPGSLKGYIPGFFGNDFRALTQNGDTKDIRQWILDGHSQFFWEQGFAGFYPGRYFTEKQAIKMPAYRDLMADNEASILTEFVVELMNLGPLDGETLIEYSQIRSSGDSGSGDSASQNPVEPAPGQDPLFVQVSQIFTLHCLKCHGQEKQRSGYRMDTRSAAMQGGEIAEFSGTPAISPGNSSSSLVYQFVTALEEDPMEEIYPMPSGDNPRLTEAEIEVLRQWIDTGATWPGGLILEEN